MANVSNSTTCLSLNNHPCMTRPNLIHLNPDEYNQELRYHPFMVNLNRCMEVVVLLMIYPVEYLFQTKFKRF